jgi:hypothetical protein
MSSKETHYNRKEQSAGEEGSNNNDKGPGRQRQQLSPERAKDRAKKNYKVTGDQPASSKDGGSKPDHKRRDEDSGERKSFRQDKEGRSFPKREDKPFERRNEKDARPFKKRDENRSTDRPFRRDDEGKKSFSGAVIIVLIAPGKKEISLLKSMCRSKTARIKAPVLQGKMTARSTTVKEVRHPVNPALTRELDHPRYQ